MESIRDKVAIIGMGCSKFGERWDADMFDLMVEAAYEAYEDARIDPKQIQAAWYGTCYSAMTGMPLAEALKTEYIPVTRVEDVCCTATQAFINASCAVAAGVYDIALAIGVEKLKDQGLTGLIGPAEETGTLAPGSAPAMFALAAVRYAHHYGIKIDDLRKALAQISVKNHHNGTFSPKAHFQREITLEQALNAPIIAWPLGLFDCCGTSDGSAAAIITRPEIARKFRDDYVLLKGFGLATGAKQGQLQSRYDFVHFPENVASSKMAYAQAGIKDPLNEIDHAIVHDCFTITELIIYEDFGFSPRGKGIDDVNAGTFALNGKLAVNTDGGLKCFGHPVGASGLRMVYEVYKQLQGKAGQRQRKNPRFGMTHNLGGAPGKFTCAITILGRKD